MVRLTLVTMYVFVCKYLAAHMQFPSHQSLAPHVSLFASQLEPLLEPSSPASALHLLSPVILKLTEPGCVKTNYTGNPLDSIHIHLYQRCLKYNLIKPTEMHVYFKCFETADRFRRYIKFKIHVYRTEHHWKRNGNEMEMKESIKISRNV